MSGLITLVTGAVLVVARALILSLPDPVLGKIFKAVARLAYALTGDAGAETALGEVADIFESGPPFTTTVRKVIRGVDTEFLSGAIIGLTTKSPYGAE